MWIRRSDGHFFGGSEHVRVLANPAGAIHPDRTTPVEPGEVIRIDDALNDQVYWNAPNLERGTYQRLPIDLVEVVKSS